jgi:hypothetical protein
MVRTVAFQQASALVLAVLQPTNIWVVDGHQVGARRHLQACPMRLACEISSTTWSPASCYGNSACSACTFEPQGDRANADS